MIVTGIATCAVLAGCVGGGRGPKAAPADAERPSAGVAPVASTATASRDPRRHRVGETDAQWRAVIEPWYTCMKEHGADTDTEPPNIKGAERWMAEHSGAVHACQSLAPLPPWGLDPANPQYRNNIHQWVKCMNDRGLKVIETPDDEHQPWQYAGDTALAPEEKNRIEHQCEKETIGKSDQ
jgi:hypothetical protein